VRPRHRFILVVSAVVLLAACSPVDATSPTNSPDAAADRAGTVDVGGGRDLYLECHGSGSPTVILVSGLGDSAEVWSTRLDETEPETPTVFDDVADLTRVCAYDRPGTGGSRSTEVDQPTSAQTSADDLHELLTASGEEGPFVLAGHSYGGPIIRLFAGDHPNDVAGLVLVDGLSEDLQAGLTAEQQVVFEQLNTPAQAGAEFFDYATLVTQLGDSAPVGDVPVIVLTADTPQLTPEVVASGQLPAGVDQAFADALWAAQLSAQDLLPAKFTDAVHVTDTQSDHYIQLANPQLVIDSISDVVNQVRETDQE
jgi:pimeloyl-ACP methyl ester carboxylesterase